MCCGGSWWGGGRRGKGLGGTVAIAGKLDSLGLDIPAELLRVLCPHAGEILDVDFESDRLRRVSLRLWDFEDGHLQRMGKKKQVSYE